jgi:hypothetical protein
MTLLITANMKHTCNVVFINIVGKVIAIKNLYNYSHSVKIFIWDILGSNLIKLFGIHLLTFNCKLCHFRTVFVAVL